MKRAQILIPAGLGLFLVLAFVWGFRATADCPTQPYDKSQTLQDGSVYNCGDTNWELEAAYGSYIFDEGEYDATGTCTGGYQDCNCHIVATGFKAPSKSFESFFVSDTEYEWWWNITNYYPPTYDGCTTGTCAGNGYSSETDSTYIDPNAGWDDESYSCVF